MFEAVKPILDESDLAVANLESPEGNGGKKYTCKEIYLKGRPESLDALAYAGFGLVTLSNNHILDYGPKVMDQTVEGLRQRGILSVGVACPGDEADRAVYVKIREVTLAFLGYCSVCPNPFFARGTRPGVRAALPKVMSPEIRLAKSKADFVIVMVHWGKEYHRHNSYQNKLARALKKAGADLVIGAHPHVPQKT